MNTLGCPITIKVGWPDKKSYRTSFNQISFETIKELQLNLDLSKRGTKKLISTLRKSVNTKVMESDIMSALLNSEKELHNAYEKKSLLFEIGQDKCVRRDLVLVKDVKKSSKLW